ncbi:secreted antigen 1 [Babesia divergens]|uniref:Secreted antigen 1 n=1 Tax=Babesia divergens TaxID=32595 RepID=A0AAD9LJT7_BABDI|nr:secreted antigen 1 [Babesia divergens]
MSVACTEFPEPQDLKEILELLHKLNDARSISGAVLVTLEGEAKKYFKDSDSDGLSSVLWNVFTKAKEIRGSIISDTGTYQKYSSLDSHEGHDCVPNALKKFLPRGYAALLFMLFNCDSEFSGYSLGAWRDQKVNGSGGSTKDLFNWLTKEETLKPLTPGLIKRGFSDLSSNDGQTVADNIKTIISHESTGPLQKALSHLLFACEWDPALLGHACLFLHKFCSEVSTEGERLKGKFKGYSEELKNVCLGLSGSLQPFVSGSSQSHILAVSQGGNVYNDVFKNDSLDAYCDWLRGNLKNIIGSLEKMSSDCKTWGTSISFEWGYTAGPFLYGFVPKDKSWMNRINENLPKAITPLIESLNELEKALQTSSSVSSSSGSSAGATAGGVTTGVLGAGGLGFGAAYATNAFGFQNFISGLISSFLK